MGVQNFWQLIESTGRPVNMNKGLEGKVLAIDISIWLHQAAKGMRDRQNPHILLLLHRICKLLHFKIKPIFIFDGGVPELKRRTLAERRQRREVAESKANEAKSKIRTNYLKMIAIQQLRGEEIQSLSSISKDDGEKDLFELPETHLRSQLVDHENEDDDDEIIETNELEPIVKHQKQRTTWSRKRPDNSTNYHYALPNFNEMDDSTLSNLPLEMQYDILTEMKESLKRGKHQQEEDMPQKSNEFSDYQIQKLLKQNSVSQKIVSLNKAIKRQKFDIPTESNAKVYAGKLASDANTQYILIKSDTESKLPPVNLTQVSSITSTSLNRRSTSDFSANDIMNRDPVSGLTQQLNLNNDEQPEVKTDVREESKIETKSVDKPIINFTEENDDEERAEIELAIRISLENQEQPIIEQNKNELSDAAHSSSDSDDSDFIDVPTIAKSSEPILLPSDDENADIIETSNNTTNNTTFELDYDESSDNSTAIEDIKTFIENDKQQELTNEVEQKDSSHSQIEMLDQLQVELMNDTVAQTSKVRANERLTATLNDTMHEETQYLLRLFGIPYIVSPTEAEAQCAYLDLSHQCDGVITDDSDVWLFGASHVYRHFFRQNQLVEYYDSTIIANQLGLDRETMIAIGMIVGSDYTKGIPNAGIMTALEILQEFHGTCMERLEKFRRWWKKAQKPGYTTQSKTLKRLKNLEIFEGFPNQAVYDAYQNPKINSDQSKFTWAMPQLELLREFIGNKLKWDRRKIDDMILPVIKRMNTKELQSRIDSFFAPALFDGTSSQLRKNTRLKSALDLLKEKTREAKELGNDLYPSDDDDDDDDTPIPERNAPKKRKRTRNTTKLMNDVVDVTKKTKQRLKKANIIASPNLSDDETI